MRIQNKMESRIPTDSEDARRFAELTGVHPMIEECPLEKACEAYARMMSGKAEFRVVLAMWGVFASGIARLGRNQSRSIDRASDVQYLPVRPACSSSAR